MEKLRVANNIPELSIRLSDTAIQLASIARSLGELAINPERSKEINLIQKYQIYDDAFNTVYPEGRPPPYNPEQVEKLDRINKAVQYVASLPKEQRDVILGIDDREEENLSEEEMENIFGLTLDKQNSLTSKE